MCFWVWRRPSCAGVAREKRVRTARTTRCGSRRGGCFVGSGESNPLLTKHLEQYESWSEKCYFWRNVNPKTKSEAKNITFCAEDDILAIQMLRQECGVSSEKIRQRADVRDVVACHAEKIRQRADVRDVVACHVWCVSGFGDVRAVLA